MYYNTFFSKVNHLQIIYNRALAVFRAIFSGHLQRRAAGSATRRPGGGCGRAPSFEKSVVSTWVIIIYVLYYILYVLYYILYV